ncbi:MAG: KaiB domain [Betaproteobacteria bacterium]|nr:KaiB domain [Betaproteobacteria bacterium]
MHLRNDTRIRSIPTVVRRTPSPIRKLIGHLPDTDRVLTR